MKFYEEVTANYTRGLIKLKNGSPLRPMLKLFLEDELVSNKPKGISNLFKINIKVWDIENKDIIYENIYIFVMN